MEEERSADFDEALRPKPVPWRVFESEVNALIERAVHDYTSGAISSLAKVFFKPKYISLLKGTKIAFNCSVEMMPVDTDWPTLIWLWECKDFPNRNVKVDDVEAFHSKLTQTGAHKGTVVTRRGFDARAIAAAKSFKLGLATLRQETMTTIHYSQNGRLSVQTIAKCPYCLTTSGDDSETPALHDYIFGELAAAGFERSR